jgi:hypothetical protein
VLEPTVSFAIMVLQDRIIALDDTDPEVLEGELY